MRAPTLRTRHPIVPTTAADADPPPLRRHDFARTAASVAGTRPALHPWAAAVWVLSGGRHGSLSVSHRRLGCATSRLTRLALVEGRSRDRYVVEPASGTSDVARDYIHREQARVVQKVNRVQADLRSAVVRGPHLPWSTRWVYAALIMVVLGVDTVLNSPLTERLAGTGPLLSLLVSFSISILLLLVSHLVVAGTPPGRRVSLRRGFVAMLLVGFAAFVAAGGYLRTHSSAGGRRGSLGLSGAGPTTTWTDLLGPATLYATAIGLLVTTFAAACLAGLHQQHQLDRLRADDAGGWARQIEVRCEQVLQDGAAALGQLEVSSRQLTAVHRTAYRLGLPVDVADRLARSDNS